jgi:hypothetical protein
MTNRLLVLNITGPSGNLLLDEEIDYKRIVLRSFSYRSTTVFDTPIYIRFNGLGGNIVSNINVFGFPLHFNGGHSVWTPNIPVELTRRMPKLLSYDIINNSSQLVSFTNISKFELVFSLEK